VQLCQPRKQIWEALHPVQTSLDVGKVLPYDANDDPENDDIEVGNLFPPQVSAHGGARPQTKGFAASTAEATGMTKRSINQHIARADALGDEALAKVVNTSLDSGVELDALAKLDAPERAELKLEVESVVPPQVSTHGGARPQTKADLGGAAS